MKKERFDFVFGLGAACSCSRILRERGLQYAAFPLDWVGDPCLDAGEDLRLTADIAAGGYEHWFEEENLDRAPQYDSEKYLGFFDRGTRLFFIHDFSPDDDVHSEYPGVREKYIRRIKRFQTVISAARKVLVVWIADPRGKGEAGETDIKYCLDAFRRAYPASEFKLLVVNCVPGIPPESARVSRGEGYECFSFDYRVVTKGPPTWDIRSDLFAPILDRYSAVDYRTRSEKRANAAREKVRAYEKYKAKSGVSYMINRMQYKLYCHLKRSLERKGVLYRIAGMEENAGCCQAGGCR